MRRPHRKLPQFNPQDIERFWAKVDKTPGQGPNGDCWGWTAYIWPSGYGDFCVHHGFHVTASRVSRYIATGIDPGELLTRHTCDNRACCNPAHLLLGTPQDDADDRTLRKRFATGDRNASRKYPDRLARGERHGSHTNPEAWRNKRVFRRRSEVPLEERRRIVEDFLSGLFSHRSLGRKYNLGRMTVAKIIAQGQS